MKAIQITSLTDTTIELLLTGDVEFSIDRAKFEEYITEGTGVYSYTLDHYEPITGHRETCHHVTMDEYWAEYGDAQVEHINDYLEAEPALVAEIALQDVLEYAAAEGIGEASLLLLKSKVMYYAHTYFKNATN